MTGPAHQDRGGPPARADRLTLQQVAAEVGVSAKTVSNAFTRPDQLSPATRKRVLAAGWTTFAVLLATAWLVPWYAIWVLPFAAICRSRTLLVGTVMLCAYMLVIAVPV